MINKEKLIKYINKAPFPEDTKKKLVELAQIANEEQKNEIAQLVAKYTKKLNDSDKNRPITEKEMKQLQEKAQKIKDLFRKKGEEIVHNAEAKMLKEMEDEISSM